jgi:uncharacterized membrane protein
MSNRRRRSAGSILVNTAIALSLIIITLIGTELGYMFYLKRELQKTADLAALAGAQGLGANNCTTATAAAIANAAQNMPVGLTPLGADGIVCGRWDPMQTPASPHFAAPLSGEDLNAVRVVISRAPALLMPGIAGNQAGTITVEAMAARMSPRAALTIRSTLLAVDSTKSPLLNAVFGSLLGGSVNLSAGGWDGLVKTQINLLSYLDRLAINLGVGAGQYNQLLMTDASVNNLLQAAIDVMRQNGGTAQATLDAIAGLLSLQTSIPAATPLVKLGDLLQMQSGTSAAGLDLNLQAFQLIQAIVQAANGKNALAADVPLSIPGIVTVSVKLKVIEPPQISAVGNPELAKLAPDGPNGIFVRTAQVRALITADLPGLSVITNLLNTVTNLLAPVTSLLNSVLSLNLQNILCLSCTQTRAVLVPDDPVRVSIGLNVASGKAKVTDFNCTAPALPSLTTQTQTSVAEVQVGQIANADEAAFFSSKLPPPIQPIPVLDVQTAQCTTVLGIQSCGSWTNYSRTGLKADTTVGATSAGYTYVNPPPLNQDPAYHSLAANNLVNSVASTLSGLQLQTYYYSPGGANHFGDLIGTATQLLQTAFGAVQTLIQTLLSPLLDPVLNFLTTYLGINLAQTDVGARLTCASGAELVY